MPRGTNKIDIRSRVTIDRNVVETGETAVVVPSVIDGGINFVYIYKVNAPRARSIKTQLNDFWNGLNKY